MTTTEKNEKAKQFEELCKAYSIPEEVMIFTKPIYDWIIFQHEIEEIRERQEKQPDYRDIDLLQLCKAIYGLEKGYDTIRVGGETITDSTIVEYIKLCLHNYITLMFPPDTSGKIELLSAGFNGITKLSKKEMLQGMWGIFNLHQPNTEEEISALISMENCIVTHHKLWQGKQGKGLALLGDKAIEAFASFPEEIQNWKKTDRLNFLAEVMELAGLLKNNDQWKKYQMQIASANNNTITFEKGYVRKSITDMIDYWIKSAIEANKKTMTAECKDHNCNDCFCSLKQNIDIGKKAIQ